MSSNSIKKSLERGLGPDIDCKYYPCHFDGQDCTWCFCLFYPCLDSLTGGRQKISSRTGKEVWSCMDCRWNHDPQVANIIFEKLSEKMLNRKELIRFRSYILEDQ
jgi:Zn-finger protein|tara:strand:+ start:1707 stop:2021 length:315 start_codon:yes stop_codon:yes gene_type:complete